MQHAVGAVTRQSVFGGIADIVKPLLMGAVALGFAGCGGGASDSSSATSAAPTYTVGVTVAGLSGTGLVLQNNGGNNLAIAVRGSFVFTTSLANGATYAVTALSQPTGPTQTCVIANGSGTVAASNVSIAVTCTTTRYTVGVNVKGLSGSGLVLRNNGGDDLAIPANGAFTFSTSVASGASYALTTQASPMGPSQTCDVTNPTGTVTNSNVVLAVACTTNSFLVDVHVSGLAGSGLVLQNNGGNDLAITTSGNAVFSTPVLTGTTYDVRVLTQPATPNQRCTVANGRGVVNDATVTAPTVTCVTQVPRFAYSVDNSNATLSIYAVDAATGQLRPRGYVPTGSNPIMAISDPAQKFWFALSAAAAKLSVYRHNDVTGDLVEVSGSPYATGGTANTSTGPSYVVVHPSGNFVYVVNGSGTNDVAAFAIDSTVGSLTPIAGSPFAAGTNPLTMTIDANGAFAYVTNRGSNNIYTYSINSSTGALTEIANSRIATGGAPGLLSIHPNGRLAYLSNNTDGTISAYTINSSTGLLTAVGNAVAAGTNPASSVAIHASGKFLYLRNSGAADASGSVSAYSINQTSGALTAIGAPVAIDANSARLTMDAAGKFLFVANQGASTANGSLSEFSINPTTGALTALTGVPTWPGRPFTVAIDPSGKYVYVTSAASNTHYSYSLDQTTGALTPVTRGALLTSRDLPISLSVYSSISTPTAATFSSKYAYVTNGNSAGSVGAYAVNATTGALSLVDTATFGSMLEPVASAVTQDGATLTVVNRTGNALWFYYITSTGALSSLGSGAFTAGGTPSAVALDSSGRFAYTANSTTVSVFSLNPSAIGTAVNNFGAPVGFGLTSNGRFLYTASNSTLGRWVVDPTTGALLGGGGVTIGGGTTSLTLEPSGRFVYLGSNTGISVYTIDSIDGFTPNTAASTLATGSIRAMAVEPTGRFLYAANGTGNTVSAYSINQVSGALTAIGIPMAAGTNVTSITTDYSGNYVYAVNQGSNTTTAYSISATTGALSVIPSGGAATGTNANSITMMNVMQ